MMKFKNAFSMMELVFVIVVIGILASLAIPRMDRDFRQEAIDSIMSDLMLTQRMALSDYRHDANSTWQRTYWQWQYFSCDNGNLYYAVFADKNVNGTIDADEIAIDPYNQKYLHARNDGYCINDKINSDNSERVLISQKFAISDLNMTGGCSGNAQQIAFDELGRPHNNIGGSTSPNYASLMKTDCRLTFAFNNGIFDNNDSFTLVVEAISGRVYTSD